MLTPVFLSLLLASPSSQAKDLRSRVGLGFDTGLGHGSPTTSGSSPAVPALSLRVGLPTGETNLNLQIEVDGGFIVLAGEEARLVLGGRGLYGLVTEDNMNLYLGVGAAYVGQGSTGIFRLQPTASAQFFLFGLENLGLSASWGVSLDLGDPRGTRAMSIGGAPALAFHYYF